MKEASQEKLNLFDKLGTDVRTFLHEEKVGDSKHLKEQLQTIKKDIQALIKVAIMKNVEQSDMQEITISTPEMSRIEFYGNRYNNILNARKKTPAELEKLFISRATQGQIKTTTGELEEVISKKIKEEEFRNEILGMKTYHEVLNFLDMRCIKIEDKILNFEETNKKTDFNRIGLLLYTLGLSMAHKLKTYGNEKEIYIYDKTIDKTFICSNCAGYKTYIASGEKDFFDISGLSLADMEKEFTSISFHDIKQWEKEILQLVVPRQEEKSALPEEKTVLLEEKAVLPEEETPIPTTIDEDNGHENTAGADDKREVKEPTEEDKLREKHLASVINEFRRLYGSDKGFNYEIFRQQIKERFDIDLPSTSYSLNSWFGKTPYIFRLEYTLALLRGNKERALEIEGEEINRRDEEVSLEKNIELKNLFQKYFSLKTTKDQKIFLKEEGNGLFTNLGAKASRLGGLPISDKAYVKALVEKNYAQAFCLGEREYVRAGNMSRYSKNVSNIMREYKEKIQKGVKINGGILDYMELRAKGITPVVDPTDGSITNIFGKSHAERKNVHEKRISEGLSVQETRELVKKIFTDKEGTFFVTEDTYKKYLRENKDTHGFLPKNIYGLNNNFKEIDPYAHNMICSIAYLRALIDDNLVLANQERIKYMETKLAQSRMEDIQEIFMCMRNYAKSKGDITTTEWSTMADAKFIKEVSEKNHLKRPIFASTQGILPYCITKPNDNFNDMKIDTITNMLAPKIEEIRALNPRIFKKQFVF